MTNAAYERQQHEQLGRAVGLTEAEIDATTTASPGDVLPADGALICRATDEITRDVRLSDEALALVRERWGDAGAAELILTVGYYNMVSRFLESARVPLEVTDLLAGNDPRGDRSRGPRSWRLTRCRTMDALYVRVMTPARTFLGVTRACIGIGALGRARTSPPAPSGWTRRSPTGSSGACSAPASSPSPWCWLRALAAVAPGAARSRRSAGPQAGAGDQRVPAMASRPSGSPSAPASTSAGARQR